MKTAIDWIGRGKATQVNARFSAMASHYLFDPQFCNPASGWEKGQIEKNVQDSRRRFWQVMPAFVDPYPAWHAAWNDCRGMGGGEAKSDATGPSL